MKVIIYLNNFLTPSMTFVYNQIKIIQQVESLKVLALNRVNENIFPYSVVVIKETKGVIYFFKKVFKKTHLLYDEKNIRFKNELNNQILEFKPDLIHVHFGPALIKIYDNLLDKNIPILVTFHGSDVSSSFRNKSYLNRLREILKRKNVFGITVSEEMKKRIGLLGIEIDRITTDYLGVDVDFFKPSGHPKSKIFLQVSNFVEKKGHEITIRAFQNFLIKTKEDVKLVLAGEGPLRKKCIELASKLGISDFVDFPGYANRLETRDLMDNSICFLHHSVTAKNGDKEGIPTVIMEAMAMNLPVISTRHSGISELVREGVDGFLVNEFDVEDYSSKMEKILNFDIGKSRDFIKSNFNLQVNSKKLLNIYEKSINL